MIFQIFDNNIKLPIGSWSLHSVPTKYNRPHHMTWNPKGRAKRECHSTHPPKKKHVSWDASESQRRLSQCHVKLPGGSTCVFDIYNVNKTGQTMTANNGKWLMATLMRFMYHCDG